MASVGEHTASLRDISRALSRKYPENLRYKLLERKAKCLVGLKLYTEAAPAFEEAEKVSSCSTRVSMKHPSGERESYRKVRLHQACPNSIGC